MGADIWLINVYLCLLVFINACLFVRIVREELFAKIKSQPRSSAASQRLQSTSVLVLVFGIYYIIFLPMSVMPKDRLGATLDCIKLFYEHFFNSFQAQREQKRLLLQTGGRWLKARGILKPPRMPSGWSWRTRRNNRRARRGAENGKLDPDSSVNPGLFSRQQQLCDDIKEDKEIA
uniref:G_PROTEIN_RECEP_F1_2 domain-containing protein n=1 Tax=Macrostomum lignano TaxID=282301 RepID=A0A1I8FPE6_9PLAT